MTYHREEIKAIRRWSMGNAGGGRRKRISGKPVGEDINRKTSGNQGAVGGATSLIWRVCKGNKAQSRGAKEEGMVEPRGDRKKTSGHPGRPSGS